MINKQELEAQFEKAGLRIKFDEREKPRIIHRSRLVSFAVTWRPPYVATVEQDKHGEYFEIGYEEDCPALQVIDANYEYKHILVRDPSNGSKFLFGHDERHLFISEVASNSRNIVDALIRIAPSGLHNALRGRKKIGRKIWARKTPRYIRQGEWFFIPAPELVVDERQILYNEPLQRDIRSKAHTCQEMYRFGGDSRVIVVYGGARLEFDDKEYTEKMSDDDFRRRHTVVRRAVRGAEVFVRGKVSHLDHKTIVLPFWHRVEINAEVRRGSSSVGFLD